MSSLVSSPSARFRALASGRIFWPGAPSPEGGRCVFGRSSLIAADKKREGDGATPVGVWPMRRVLFRPDRGPAPASELPVLAIKPDMGWCDDPGSPAYNTLVALPFAGSHERMNRDDQLYDLVIELGYNDAPVVAGRGSAIFLHVAAPDWTLTEGCVATDIDSLRALVAAARPGDALEVAG